MAEKKSLIARMFLPSEPEQGTVRYPLLKIIFGPYMIFIDNFRSFFFSAGVYALIMTAVYLIGRQALVCLYGSFEETAFCSSDPLLYIGVRIVVLFVIAAFCVRYYQTVWLQRQITLRFLLQPCKTDLYSATALIVFILLNAVSGLSWYLLAVRVPDPDWRIELAYFGVVASGFVIPFVLLRFYSLLADVWSGGRLSSPLKIWRLSRGNNLRLILSMSLWFFLLVFSLSAVSVKLGFAAGENSFYAAVVGEYIFNFAVLILMSFFINYCGLQKLFLTEGETNEKSEND